MGADTTLRLCCLLALILPSPPDAERCRGSPLARFWLSDFDITCSEETATTYQPSALLYASLSFPPHLLSPTALPADNNMSTSDDAGYSGRLRSSTRPNQEAQTAGGERLRSRPDSCLGSRDSRRGGPPDEGSGYDNKNNTIGHHQGTPTDRVDSPARKEEAEQSPPG